MKGLLQIAANYSDDYRPSQQDLFRVLVHDLLATEQSGSIIVYERSATGFSRCFPTDVQTPSIPSIIEFDKLSLSERCRHEGTCLSGEYAIFHSSMPIYGATAIYGIVCFVRDTEIHLRKAVVERLKLIPMVLDLFYYRSQVRDDLRRALEIQTSLLPQSVHSPPGFDISFWFRPARMVSGDYYNVFVEDDHLTTIVGDVSGKGIGAALMMAYLSAQINELRKRKVRHLADIIALINTALYDSTPPDCYVTLHYNVVDLDSLLMSYVSAGHQPPALHLRNGRSTEVSQLQAGGLMLGLFPTQGLTFEVGEVALQRGDALVIATDGVTDSENVAGIEFGMGGLQ